MKKEVDFNIFKACGWSHTGHTSGACLPTQMCPQLWHCQMQSPSREKTSLPCTLASSTDRRSALPSASI